MGTRSNTIIADDEVQILNLYRQYDGNTSGHGAELLAFLEPIIMVNGFSMGVDNQANGAGCLAAQMIAHFKTGVGGFYIESLSPDGKYDNDYTYIVRVQPAGITLKVMDYDGLIFDGTIADFKAFVTDHKNY
jgi:hypothetical protein